MNSTLDPNALPLRDIHLPAGIGWWPPAPGWWLLGILLAGSAIWALARFYRRRPQRAALRALRAVTAALASGEAPVQCAQQISTILRRYALTLASEREQVAGLAGVRWLEYLDSRWRRQAFTAGGGQRLAAAPYAPRISLEEARELGRLGMAWIKAQRR